MSIIRGCLIVTKFHEGVKYNCYLDTKGLLTWGIGWNLQGRKASPTERQEIESMMGLGKDDIPWDYPVALGRWLDAQSQLMKVAIATFMHSNTLSELIPEVETRIGYFPDLNTHQQMGIVDLCYNMGIERWISLFPKTNMLMVQGKYAEASVELLDSDYHRDLVKLRPHTGFVLRSERISKMIRTGEWPDDTDFKNDAGPEPKE